MKHLAIVAFCTALLTACATSNQVRQEAPYKQLNVAKPANVLVGCVADRLESGRAGGDVVQRSTLNGYAVSVIETWGMWGKNTTLVIDIEGKGQSSDVTINARTAFDSDKARLFSIVEPCF